MLEFVPWKVHDVIRLLEEHGGGAREPLAITGSTGIETDE